MQSDLSAVPQRIERWEQFLGEPDPPAHLFLVQCPWDVPPRPMLWPTNKGERLDWMERKFERQMDRLNWLDDDALPFIDMISGTEIFAEAFGCEVERPDGQMPFAQPLISEASEVAGLKVPEVFDSTLALQFELADEARRRMGDEVLMRLPDIQSPMDVAALIWDKNTLYIAMLESPEAVLELANKTRELLIRFVDAWHERYGQRFIAHFPDYYMPGGITLSEDECGIVSEEMFRQFFLPGLEALAAHFGQVGMHCCASARHQWENFRRIPNLKLINLVKGPDYVREAWEVFEHHCAQLHSWPGEGDCETWPDQYPRGAKMVIEVPSEDRLDASRKAERMRKACQRRSR